MFSKWRHKSCLLLPITIASTILVHQASSFGPCLVPITPKLKPFQSTTNKKSNQNYNNYNSLFTRNNKHLNSQQQRQHRRIGEHQYHHCQSSPNHNENTPSTKKKQQQSPPTVVNSSSSSIFTSPPIASLPITPLLNEIHQSLHSKPNLLLEAPPGAGKTTVIPLSLLLHHHHHPASSSSTSQQRQPNILLVEPRRVATISTATRLSTLHSTPLGTTIGYAIRDDTLLSPSTKITVMTYGVLLSQLRRDVELHSVDVVIFDEFHERSVDMDVCLALCRDCQRQLRNDLKLVIMSATLLGGDMGRRVRGVLGGEERCGVMRSEGRQFPITLRYGSGRRGGGRRRGVIPSLGALINDRELLIDTTVDATLEALAATDDDGDILVFLPGAREIRETVRRLSSSSIVVDDNIEVLPLYGSLPPAAQSAVIRGTQLSPRRQRRRTIVISSPIAEASLTLPSIATVVDSGLRRILRGSSSSGLPRLATVKCSRSSADQRAGRAGRLRPGTCFRLYGEGEYERLATDGEPEIVLGGDVSGVVLVMMDWGCCERLGDFGRGGLFVDEIPRGMLERARDLLLRVGAIEERTSLQKRLDRKTGGGDDDDVDYVVTSHGRRLVTIPTHPRFATAIVRAAESLSSEEHSNDATVNDGNDCCYRLVAAVATAVAMEDDAAAGLRTPSPSSFNNVLDRIETVILSSASSPILSKRLSRYVNALSSSDYGNDDNNHIKKLFQQTIHQARTDPSTLRHHVLKSSGEALLPGFADLVAKRQRPTTNNRGVASFYIYDMTLGHTARLDTSSTTTMPPEYIIILETTTNDDGTIRIRSFLPIDERILRRDVAVTRDIVTVDDERGYEVKSRRSVRVEGDKGFVELSSLPLPSPSAAMVTEVLLETIRRLGGVRAALLNSEGVTMKVNDLRERVRQASKAVDSFVSPPCFVALEAENDDDDDDDSDNVNSQILEDTIEPWLGTVKSLRDIDIYDILRSTLTTDHIRTLDQYYPTRIIAPDGSSIPVSYSNSQERRHDDDDDDDDDGGIVRATAKLQQFFGTVDTPCVGPPHRPRRIVLDLTSPAGRVVASTSDLSFFWKEVYPSVRAELRGRYAKHPWPEDPMTAVATRRTTKGEERRKGEGGVMGGDNGGVGGDAGGRKKGKGKKR